MLGNVLGPVDEMDNDGGDEENGSEEDEVYPVIVLFCSMLLLASLSNDELF